MKPLAHERTGIQRFELLRPLGSGSSGMVFEARELASGARLAIKILKVHSGIPLYQFKREFRALAELSHPNVVQLRELFEHGGRFYLTMELIEGTDFIGFVRPGVARPSDLPPTHVQATQPEPLADERRTATPRRLKRRGAVKVSDGDLDAIRLRHALAQLCSGLIALHAAGFVHRDVKPQNVLVTDTGRVVLLDFGLAVGATTAERRTTLEGTVAYMAPEQAMGLPVTESADWYAVGVMLYEALTGRLPHGDVPFRKLHAPGAAAVPHPSSLARNLPEDLCELCVELLQCEPRRRPSEDAIAGIFGLEPAEVRASASFRSRVFFNRRTFVGRRTELAVLYEALANVRERGCVLLRIQGESGVGKSALVRQFVTEVARADPAPLVFAGRCYERETVPYHGMDGVVDELARHVADSLTRDDEELPLLDARLLAAAFPVFRAVPGFADAERHELLKLDPHEARRRAFAALRDLLQAASEKAPVIVHIDDAQWIDAESASLLSFLAQGATGLLVIVAERCGRDDRLASLTACVAHTAVLSLARLSQEESERLAATLLSDTKSRTARNPGEIAKKSDGHPLFLQELVLHSSGDESTEVDLERAISSRIAQLDEGSRRFLETIALASTPMSHEVARIAAELSPIAYQWTINALRAENLITFHAFSPADDVQIYHDRIREVALVAMSADLRRKMHHSLAFTIEAHSPESVDAIAHHYLEAGVRDKAAEYTRAAGHVALEQLAFERAIKFFELALALEEAPPTRARISEHLGIALAGDGHGQKAAEAYLQAAALSPSSHDAMDLRRRAAEQFLRAGHLQRGTELLFTMLRERGFRVPATDLRILSALLVSLLELRVRLRWRAPDDTTGSERAAHDRLLLDACWSAANGLTMVHHLMAVYFQVHSLLLALEAGDREYTLKSAALLGASLSMADGFPRELAGDLLRRAQELARAVPSPENEAWLAINMGAAAMAEWDFAKCREYCSRAERLFKEVRPGTSWEIVTAQAFALWSLAFSGNLPEARARLPELLGSALARGDRYAHATLVLSPLHLVGLAADEPRRVRDECTRILSEWPADIACFQHMCGAYVLAQTDLYDGRARRAWEHVLTAWRMLRRSHLSRVQFQRVDLLGLRARAALARAASERGIVRNVWIRRARRDAKRLAAEGLAAAAAMSALVRAGAQCAQAQPALAAASLEAASAGFAANGMLLHAAVADLGRTILGRSDGERTAAERRLERLGVSNCHKMLRLWLPTMPGFAWSLDDVAR